MVDGAVATRGRVPASPNRVFRRNGLWDSLCRESPDGDSSDALRRPDGRYRELKRPSGPSPTATALSVQRRSRAQMHRVARDHVPIGRRNRPWDDPPALGSRSVLRQSYAARDRERRQSYPEKT